MDIKNLELTEKDLAGDMFEGIMMGLIKKDGADSQQLTDFEMKRQVEKRKKEMAKEALKEDIKILQGKLLMFKRYLIQQDALKQVDEMLNPLP